MKIRPFRFVLSPAVKAVALSCVGVLLFAVVAAGGCSSSSTPGSVVSPPASASPTGSPSASPSPTSSPTPTPTANDFVVMNYPSIPPTTDPSFGEVQGYMQLATLPASPSPFPTVSSGTVTVHCNQNIQFYNLDHVSPHTASLLGPAAGPSWPPYFNNVNGASVASPLLTAITTPEFSTGSILTSGSKSVVYSTGVTAGSFNFGDYFDYNPINSGNPQMRTVITILCP